MRYSGDRFLRPPQKLGNAGGCEQQQDGCGGGQGGRHGGGGGQGWGQGVGQTGAGGGQGEAKRSILKFVKI